jgi:hypothetical protein
MRDDDFRRMALGMAGAVEGAHMGHPDFRVNARIFATIHPDRQFGMVTLTPDQQQQFIHDHSDTFAPENGAWGRAGCTRVRLDLVHEETLGEAMTLAWQNTIEKGPPKRTTRKRSPRPQRPSRKPRPERPSRKPRPDRPSKKPRPERPSKKPRPERPSKKR